MAHCPQGLCVVAEWGGGRSRAGTWPPREAARAGGCAPPGIGTWSSFVAKLQDWVRAEAGAGRLLPWIPIAFGAGIAVYFAVAREPVAWVTAIAGAVLCTA